MKNLTRNHASGGSVLRAITAMFVILAFARLLYFFILA